MALRIELKGTTPGCADLHIGGGGREPGPIEIAIQRRDEMYLAGGGTWQTEPFWHRITSVDVEVDGIVARVGPDIVDPLVQSWGMGFFADVRSTSVNGRQIFIKPMGRLLGSQPPSELRSDPTPVVSTLPNDTRVLTTPTESSEPAEPAESLAQVEPQTPPEPDEPPDPPPARRTKLWLWILLVLLLLAFGATAAWYFDLFGGKSRTATGDPATEPVAGVDVPGALQEIPPDTSPALSGRARAQAYLRDDPAPGDMLATAVDWERSGDCEAALIVLNTAAGSDAAASMALAERYDPASAETVGCIVTADPETAIYWYERPAEQGDRVAQSRLGLLLTERNMSGPLYERGLGYLRQASQAGDAPAAERLRELGE